MISISFLLIFLDYLTILDYKTWNQYGIFEKLKTQSMFDPVKPNFQCDRELGNFLESKLVQLSSFRQFNQFSLFCGLEMI